MNAGGRMLIAQVRGYRLLHRYSPLEFAIIFWEIGGAIGGVGAAYSGAVFIGAMLVAVAVCMAHFDGATAP